jgi:hypothetical protein
VNNSDRLIVLVIGACLGILLTHGYDYHRQYRERELEKAEQAKFERMEAEHWEFQFNSNGTPRHGYSPGGRPFWHRAFYDDQPRVYDPETITPENTPPGRKPPTIEEQKANLKPKGTDP